ncbi:MAG: DUF1640 domain-containing protein [Magnetococcales bacterium]|nr:DUF1640 domain-containing protein [Magnetococcales bacterium]
MTAVTFDTMRLVESLQSAGFDETQAKGITAAIREAQETRLDDVATKGDVVELKRDIRELDSRTEARFKEMELRMTIKLGGMILLGAGLVVGMLRAWPLPVQYVPAPGMEFRPPQPSVK